MLPNISIVVPLHTPGDKTPFWCIHPPGGNVLTYAKLAYRIGETHPFYAIQHPILSGQKGNDKLEDLASDYVAQLLDVQPRGPYILSGWSMGGIVAIEMARQLLARRHEVSSVILFDSEWPYPPNQDVTDRVHWVENRAFTSLLRFLGEGFGVTSKEQKLLYSERVLRGILNLTAQQFMGVTFSRQQQQRLPHEWLLIADQVLEKLIGFNARLGFVPYGLLSRLAPSQQTKLLLRLLRLLNKYPDNLDLDNVVAFMDAFRQHLQCVCQYQPQPLDVKLALFLTGEESSYNLEGWRTCTTHELQTYSTPGNHFTLLTEPNVGELAKKILKIIA